MRDAQIGTALLRWYDREARVLPWRIGPAERAAGMVPAPYRVWLSEIMLQQTTVAAVNAYFERFTRRWPTVTALASADDAAVMAEWAGLGYYARARNLLACARAVVGRFGGRFPQDRAALLSLPGIGPYTAAAIAAIAFDAPETVVDGNVERVVARLDDIHAPLPGSKPQLTALAARLTPRQRPGDHAQAMMDLGATICTPRQPRCAACPLRPHCRANDAGTAALLPRKTARPAKPVRHGYAYVARRKDGAWLLETRPPQGLLGGMLGFPVSDWSDAPTPAPPLAADWREVGAQARHTFTHFHLRLTILTADLPQAAQPERGAFVAAADFDASALPTLMRKVHALAAPGLRGD